MLFNSMEFAVFFLAVLALYFNVPGRFKWFVLLASSYYFYMSIKPEFIILLLVSTFTGYAGAILISEKRWKNAVLLSVFVVNLGILFFFKYFNFFSESLQALFSAFSIEFPPLAVSILLPIGISFYTFQILGYVIDVYRGNVKPEKRLHIFATYSAFFPQMLSGPIERAGQFLVQFSENRSFDYKRATDGLKLMTWGLFKKIVI